MESEFLCVFRQVGKRGCCTSLYLVPRAVEVCTSEVLRSLELADGSTDTVTLKWQPPIEEESDLHKSAVAMHFEAYNGLGVGYKLRTGDRLQCVSRTSGLSAHASQGS